MLSMAIIFPAAPNKPENIKATSSEESAVDLSWSKPNDHGGKEIRGYVIEYKESTSREWSKKISQSVITELRIDGLKSGCEYEFRVRAQNAVGNSDASEVIRQVPKKLQYSKSCSESQYICFPRNYLNLWTCRRQPTMQNHYLLSSFLEYKWVECSNVL